ncbi:SLC13 family permease [Holzapfeliella floricola]|uniref:SLC13 family permease n=1 Tax=Holzapfeliella floricola TaxID=679249 RepID=UPI0007846839|nr:SLC13 family permease [Holzapfeliella floricola]
MIQILKPLKKDYLMWGSVVLAGLTSFVSFPRVSDINWHTIGSLTMLMLVIAGCTQFGFLKNISQFLINITKNQRQLMQIMVGFSFFSSMLLTNDVAILTLVPLYLTIAANLGSAVTPFGNPQNIYLVANYHLSLLSFFQSTWILSVASFIILTLSTFFFKRKPLTKTNYTYQSITKKNQFILVFSFIVALLGLLNLVNLWLAFIVVLCSILSLKWQVILDIDYGLLLTFIGFFILIGNLGRLAIVHELITQLTTTTWQTYLTTIISSQFISNFPAAILLSQFTSNGPILLLGSNIGGLGTLVASLANILAFKQFSKEYSQQKRKFLVVFTLINLLLLLILIPIIWLLSQ